jgi:hypothetical protein
MNLLTIAIDYVLLQGNRKGYPYFVLKSTLFFFFFSYSFEGTREIKR